MIISDINFSKQEFFSNKYLITFADHCFCMYDDLSFGRRYRATEINQHMHPARQTHY